MLAAGSCTPPSSEGKPLTQAKLTLGSVPGRVEQNGELNISPEAMR